MGSAIETREIVDLVLLFEECDRKGWIAASGEPEAADAACALIDRRDAVMRDLDARMGGFAVRGFARWIGGSGDPCEFELHCEIGLHPGRAS